MFGFFDPPRTFKRGASGPIAARLLLPQTPALSRFGPIAPKSFQKGA